MQQNWLSQYYQVSEVEIVYRNKIPYQDRIQVNRSGVAYEILRQCWDENRWELVEEFKILLLDRQHHCLGISQIATGGSAACVVDAKIVFATALKANASSLILAHNHPSGHLKASQADLELTRKLCQGGKLLDLPVLDHLIVTPANYLSLADQGLMP